MKLFLAALAHETNSFSPLPTTMRSFEEGICYQAGAPAEMLQSALDFPGFGDLRALAEGRGDSVVIGPCYWAQPGGLVAPATYHTLRERLLAALQASVDDCEGVLLVLHGAMMAHGIDDCEGDLLTRVRAMVGPRLPVGVLLDLHGNLTPAMLDSGAVLIACKEYPHTDYPARAAELLSLLHAMHARQIAPRLLLRRIPVLGLFGTGDGPMRVLVDSLADLEQRASILSVSLMHGFAWSDAAATSAAVLVVYDEGASGVHADAADLARTMAEGVADSVASALFAIRTAGAASLLPLESALDQALDQALDRAAPMPGTAPSTAASGLTVLADGADNPGGGAAGDSTFVLAALLRRGPFAPGQIALGMLWDPQAVRIANDAGVGAVLALRLGGKTGPASGEPLDVIAEVLAVRADARQHGLGGSLSEPLGEAVALRIAGIDVVVNSIRQQVFSPACFTALGIAVDGYRLAVVKSTRHFRARFDAIASRTLFCDTPGALAADLARLPYRYLRRPLWPLDEMTVAQATRGASYLGRHHV